MSQWPHSGQMGHLHGGNDASCMPGHDALCLARAERRWLDSGQPLDRQQASAPQIPSRTDRHELHEAKHTSKWADWNSSNAQRAG